MIKTLPRIALAIALAVGSTTPSLAADFSATSVVHPGDSVWFLGFIPAGEFMWAELSGDDRADINLYVYDEFGNLVACGETFDAFEYVEWWSSSRRGQQYHFEVHNYSGSTSRFTLEAGSVRYTY